MNEWSVLNLKFIHQELSHTDASPGSRNPRDPGHPAGVPKGVYRVGLLGAKTQIPVKLT